MNIREQAHRLKACVLSDDGNEILLNIDFPLNGDNIRMKGEVPEDGDYIIKLYFDDELVHESTPWQPVNGVIKYSIQANLLEFPAV